MADNGSRCILIVTLSMRIERHYVECHGAQATALFNWIDATNDPKLQSGGFQTKESENKFLGLFLTTKDPGKLGDGFDGSCI